jgi:chemotaxis protein MotB
MANKFVKRKPKEDSADDWMTTYADALTLLLCFMILLISISEPKEAEYNQIRKAFMETTKSEISNPFTDLFIDMQNMISNQSLEQIMSVEETEKGIVVEIASSSFYKPGSVEFKPLAVPILLDIALILQDFSYEDYVIQVEGHTDDSPTNGSGLLATNWELSAGRAARVVRFFIEETLDKERMRVKAYADTRPKVPNRDENGNPIPENREINRRIVIEVERRK